MLITNQRRSMWQGGICLVLFFIGLISSAIAQGSTERRWSVRKTGEFGRRIDSRVVLSQELELPKRQFTLNEPNLQTAETRAYSFAGKAIKKPSQNLELPNISPYSYDQLAQATGDGEGYSYSPLENDGYDYTPPAPVIKYPESDEPDPTRLPKDPPSPSEPEVVPGQGNPSFALESQIDSDSQNRQKDRPPSQTPSARPEKCDENDPDCWHSYDGVISGVAGQDYPILSEIVATDFNCDEQPFSGYYADTDERARCQIFHICLKRNRFRKTRQWSFLCPNGTVFSQNDFVCVWWGDAPECDGTTVRSLYSLNEQLGWDNITEGAGASSSPRNRAAGSNEVLQPAMSAFNPANAFSQAPLVPTTYRPSSSPFAKVTSSPSRNAQPYRVPVKVKSESGRPRTKLQEVTQNALHGEAHELDYGDTEHEVDESANFETSLKQQSESRHKTKSSSSTRKSQSEAYELKDSADGVQPFVVNRPNDSPSGNEAPPQYNYDDAENERVSQVVMMPTVQRFPDGSEGYAEVPVMFPQTTTEAQEEGYRYPNPTQGTSTPAPSYLPPFRDAPTTTQPPTTPTTEYFPPPTIPTEPPIEDHDNYEADYQTTPPTTTARTEGYRYSNPTTTEGSGYRYNQPESQGQGVDDGYRYPNPTSNEDESGYTYNRPAGQQQNNADDGYRYSNPPSTEDSGYVYNKPAGQKQQNNVDDGYNYSNPTATEDPAGYAYNKPISQQQGNDDDGYKYSNPTSTEEAPSGYEYDKPSSQDQNGDEDYKYAEQQATTAEGPGEGYKYTQPTTTEQSDSNNYDYQNPTGAERGEEEGYRYDRPTTTEGSDAEQGYAYTNPTTMRSKNLRNTNPTTTTEQPTPTTEEALEGYNYQAPEKQEQSQETPGYNNYQTPAPTEQPVTGTTRANEQNQVTDNEVTEDYRFESTRTPYIPKQEYGVPTENSGTTTTTTAAPSFSEIATESVFAENVPTGPAPSSENEDNELPAGGYLPPRNNNNDGADATRPVVTKQEGEQVDEDTFGISASPGTGGDYEDEENEVVANPSSSGPEVGSEDGYSYNLPTPPSSSNPVFLNGGALGTDTQLQIPSLREQIRSRNRHRQYDNSNSRNNDNYYNNGRNLDSDDKINEILKQIQNGGIEAVDSSGKPIEFSKLKELLLSAPRGSVELKGEVDSLSSSSTEIPRSPQTQTQQNGQEPQYFHTVTTAQVLPPNDNENNLFNTNQDPASGSPSPSGFYLPPQFSTNANNQNSNVQINSQSRPSSQQYYTNANVQVVQPSYDIKLPNREFESHSVETNTIDTNTQNNNNFVAQTINVSQQEQQVQYQQTQTFIPQPQQQAKVQQQQQQPQFFQNQNYQSNPSPPLSTSLVIPPSGNYLPPPPQPNFSTPISPNPDISSIPAPQSQPQQRFQQSLVDSQQRQQQQQQQRPISEEIAGEYLPPRQASSSILQTQYYNADASAQQPTREFLSAPIKLSENIELQQSFARPLPSTPSQGGSNGNPLLDPRNIKIVPALFVHEHTSVAAQAGNQVRESSSSNGGNSLQPLETAQTSYQPSKASSSDYGARTSLAQQLNQLANSVYEPPRNNEGRQFFRRSNEKGLSSSVSTSSSSSSSSSSSLQEPSHTIEKATRVTSFTLEDARTPEELQQYHHEDLKRFHSEHIANQGSVLDDALPPRSTTTPFEHRSGSPASANYKDEGRSSKSSRGNRKESTGSVTTSTSGNTNSSPNRFSINSSNFSSSNRARTNNNNSEHFIPVSGSYRDNGKSSSISTTSSNDGSRGRAVSGGGGGSRGSSSSNSDSSLFRVSGRRGSRSFGSQRTLLDGFFQDQNNNNRFGARLSS